MYQYTKLVAVAKERLREILRKQIKRYCDLHPDAEHCRLDYLHFIKPKEHTKFGAGQLLHAEQHCLFLLEHERAGVWTGAITYIQLTGLASAEALQDILAPIQEHIKQAS